MKDVPWRGTTSFAERDTVELKFDNEGEVVKL
jgi:hypothetical protein